MNRSLMNCSLALVLSVFALCQVAAAQVLKTDQTKSPTPAGPDLGAPAGGGNSLAAPPASIDDLKAIPDPDRPAPGLGEQQIIVTASEATRLRELELRVQHLEKLIEGQSATLQDIADKLGTPSEELRAIRDELVKLNSKQTLARPELGGDTPSLAQLGRMVVNNYTAATYTLSVNGFQVVVPPGRSEVSNLPVGAITTELLGYETPKTWAATDWRDVDGAQQLAIQIK